MPAQPRLERFRRIKCGVGLILKASRSLASESSLHVRIRARIQDGASESVKIRAGMPEADRKSEIRLRRSGWVLNQRGKNTLLPETFKKPQTAFSRIRF